MPEIIGAVVVAGFVLFKTHLVFQKKEQKLEFISVIKNILSLSTTLNPIFSRSSITFNLCGLKLDNLVDFIQFLLHN